MNICIETIKVENRRLSNILYHNIRFHRTRRALFKVDESLDLQGIITIPNEVQSGIYKCRVLYDVEIQSIEFTPYQPKTIQSLQLVQADHVDYYYKYLDRSVFDHLLCNVKTDDILMVKNGLLTDASYANVVFGDGNKWWTPALPLLAGTKRQALLDAGEIAEALLKPADLKHFSYAKLINAMLDWDHSPTIPIPFIVR